jgi:N12 class adenine-specific DNA methylase
MAYNQLQKLRGNIAAIRIALEWETGQSLSADDINALQQYAGFGGLKAILFPAGPLDEWIAQGASVTDQHLYPVVMELHQLLQTHLNENEYKQSVQSLKNSVLTAYYTPGFVPRIIYETLKAQNIFPKRIYEPSSGAGVFISEAAPIFSNIERITAVEKDMLSGKILAALASTMPVPVNVMISGLEDTTTDDNGKYDLIISNIPFGNFSVYDPAISNRDLSGKIHNYFFAKGLDKIADGGLLAYITTDAFLNNPSNQEVREYLFNHADFISISVMPDNLMKDTGNTEAPSHLLIVQKNDRKNSLGVEERHLVATIERKNEFGNYSVNQYIDAHPEVITGNEIKAGRNQYGQAYQEIWQQDVEQIKGRLSEILITGFAAHFDQQAYQNIQFIQSLDEAGKNKTFTFLPVPENKKDSGQMQLGLFDVAPAENTNRAIAYLNAKDELAVSKQTARVIATVRTTKNPIHDSIVLVTAQVNNKYVYKLYSNVSEIRFSATWMNGVSLVAALEDLSSQLKNFGYNYKYEGDKTIEPAFGLVRSTPELFTALKPYYKDGMLVQHEGKVGRISQISNDYTQAGFEPLVQTGNRTAFYGSYIAIRDSYLEMTGTGSEANSDPILRDRLSEQYTGFVQRYGLLNAPVNRNQIFEDKAFGLMIVSSLERKEGESFVPADVLYESLEKKAEHFTTEDPVEALARCLNDKGKVDIGFIEAATGLSDEEVISSLAHYIYLNPQSRKWESVDLYLSGNVVEKLRVAKEQAEQNPDIAQIQRSLEAIRKVQPEQIPFELLDFNLGERWIPLSYYNRFAGELFECDTDVDYFASLDTFKVSPDTHNAKITQEYAVTPKNGKTTYGHIILEHALENTAPFFTYEVDLGDKTVRVPDNEAIQLAHQKIESIRNGFTEWLEQLPQQDKQYLEDLYNKTFNCYVLREYDGAHLLFPGLEKKNLGIDDLYSSQKNAAWRIIQNRGALIDHEVGLGKTLTMIVAASEMKRLGIVYKPMILALKANVDQIRDTYRKAYPKARILAPGENDFTPDKRLRLFHEIKNNNWDCIILTHDQFGKIPQSPEIQREIFQNELDNVERDLDTIKEMGGDISRRMLKGLEIRKNNLEGKLKSLLVDIEEKKDKGINFEEMGVDHLFIDESHKFKNLTFTTRHNRVAGLGNIEGSQKALNMLFAVRTLQEKFDADLCVTFLSGTPISNSLTEMYLLFKYLRPKEMERQHIENFDGWAAVFARKTTDFEFSVTNEIIAKERFRHFIKVPELALFYNEITDYKTAKHIALDKPDIDETLVNIKPTPDQQEFTKNLMAFAKTGNAAMIGRPALTESEDKARMLIATNYARKMAADMRLISTIYEDHPDNKVNTCARNLAREYKESYEHKGTQIVFCDIGTPKTDEFNIYDALKEKLVRDFNIPAHEITFIHDWSDKKKPELFKKMNSGEIRILIGSTDKAGTGLNVQKRMVAMHHMDIPWKPSELEQRNGRGARQGNWFAKMFRNNKIRNYIYAVEQSLDNYKFNLLKNKQTFISQMKNCELNVRTIDEGAMDEKSGMNFSEYIAILSGDTSLLEKSKLEKKIAVMESLKKAHFKEIARSKYHLSDLAAEKKETVATLEKLGNDYTLYNSQLQYEKDGSKTNPIRLSGLNSTDPEVIGRHLIQLYNKWKPGDDPKIGTLYGFELYVRHHKEFEEIDRKIIERHFNTFYAARSETGIKYTYNSGHPNVDNPKLAARYFLNAIDKVENLKEKYNKTLQELDKEIPIVEQIISRPFDKEKELAEMKTKLASLEREIALKIQEKQMKENGQLEADAVSSEEIEVKETLGIKMEPKQVETNGLQPVLVTNIQVAQRIRKSKGLRM